MRTIRRLIYSEVLRAVGFVTLAFLALFFFQLDDGLGDAGLRGVQGLGRFGQVQAPARGFLHEAELVQVHGVC